VRPDAAAEDLMCPAVTAIEIRTDLRHTTGSGHRLPPTIPRNKSSETTHCRVDANRPCSSGFEEPWKFALTGWSATTIRRANG
ncbi:MAG: hypothetical protein WBM69_10770, partial [Desulfobacterales bacterium]